MNNKVAGTSSRILLDIPCKVCQDHSSGKHYGIFACDGCAGFFKRSIRRNRQYVCKARTQGGCPVDKTHRNQCRACRLKKCMEAGMNKDAVQHERGPRNSTIRRQVALYLKETSGSEPHPGLSSSHTASRPFMGTMVTPQNEPRDLSSMGESQFGLARTICQPIPKLGAVNGKLDYDEIYYPHEMASNNHFGGGVETICEAAARLLFLNVKWAKHVPAFTNLPHRDQLLLLEEGWRELFVLSAAQFFMPIEGGPLLAVAGLNVDGSQSDKVSSMLTEIRNFQEIVVNFRQMRVDPTEYACLKAIVLFKTVLSATGSEHRSLRDVSTVSTLQDQSQLTLSKYIQMAYPTQPFRFGKLLLMLPTIQSVNSSTIEELFFKKTIGSIPIERLICDMYRSTDF